MMFLPSRSESFQQRGGGEANANAKRKEDRRYKNRNTWLLMKACAAGQFLFYCPMHASGLKKHKGKQRSGGQAEWERRSEPLNGLPESFPKGNASQHKRLSNRDQHQNPAWKLWRKDLFKYLEGWDLENGCSCCKNCKNGFKIWLGRYGWISGAFLFFNWKSWFSKGTLNNFRV